MVLNYRRFLPACSVTMDDCPSDAEYRTRISLELAILENNQAAMKLLKDDARSRCHRLSVEGYDTNLRADEIQRDLRKIFHLACGGVFDVVVPTDPVTKRTNRFAFVYIQGEDRLRLAVAVGGTRVGDWIPSVCPSLEPRDCLLSVDEADRLRAAYYFRQCAIPICVEGYDIRRPEDGVKNALIKHFCSCGVITDLAIHRNPVTKILTSMAFLYFYGDDAVQRALSLNGSICDLPGGWTVVAKRLKFQNPYPFPHK